MKPKFSKKVLAILASAVLLICSFAGTFVVSAEDPIATPVTVDGVKYYIVANAVDGAYPTVTIDLGDGEKTYNTQSWQTAIEGAATAGVDEAVVALTEGTYSITSNYLPNNNTNGKLSIIGYGATADKIVVTPNDYFRVRYNAYLDNFTVKLGDTKSFLADGDVVFGPNFRFPSGLLYMWAYTANANTTDHTLVIDGSSVTAKTFAAFGAGDFVKQATAGGEGHLYEVTINNLKMGDYSYTDCGRILLGNYRHSLTYTGNYIFTVNNATPHASRPYIDISQATGAVTAFNGTATVILNNGMASQWTVTDNAKAAVDYVVTAPAGGYVTVKEDTKKAEVPTFVITHDNGFVPVVNGQQLTLTNGAYEYTPTATGDINVTFIDNRIYNIDGETTVFVATDKSVDYNSNTYAAYETFADAYNEVKTNGGTIVLEGTHVLSTQKGVTAPIKIVGADSSACIQVAGWTDYTGNIEIDNIKFQSKNNTGIEGNFSGNFKLGSGVTLAGNSTLGFNGINNADLSSWNAGDTLTMRLSAPGTFFFVRNNSAIGSAEKNINYQLILDGTGITSVYGNSITMKNTVYGSFTLVINDESRIARASEAGSNKDKKHLDFTADAIGKMSIIFNNGVNASNFYINDANGYVDYILNVAAGGYAYVKTQGTADTAPTYVITNTNGYVPVIDGEELTLSDGEYLYTPTATGPIDITFVDPNAPKVYDVEGEKFAFVSSTGKLTYNEVTYNAYETFEAAYNAIKGVGGNIVVEGTQTLYTESTTTTAIKVIGLGQSATKLNIPNAWGAPVYGELYLKDLTLGHLNSGNRFFADRLTLDNVKDGTGDALWLVGFRTGQASGATCYVDFKNGSTINMLGATQEWDSISSDRFDNFHVIANGGKISYWDMRIANPVYGNLTFTINSTANWHSYAKKISTGNNPTGALSIIFNNGVSDVTVSDSKGNVDYRLNVATGGYAYVKTEGSASVAPTFVITNDSGFVPVVNGTQLTLTDGEYLYQPTTVGTYDITFYDPDAPVVYDVEGENFAFVSSTGKLTYNEVTYNAYETFEAAYKAIIGVGGTIVVEGEHTIYTESTAAKAIKVLGLGKTVTTIKTKSYGIIYGEIFFDNLTLSTGAAGTQHNFYVDRFSTGNNVAVVGTMWIIGFRSSSATATCYVNNQSGTFHMLSVGHENGGTKNNAKIYVNAGSYVNYSLRVPAGITGSATFIINSKGNWGAKAIDNLNADPTGAFSVIYNNGVTGVSVTDPNNYIDYVLNVATGGYADIKTEGSASVAPTFVITAPEGKVPVANGVRLTATAGEYLYQPTTKDTNITFVPKVTVNQLTGAAVRFANPTGLRFIANIEGLDALAAMGATYEAYTMIAPIDYVNAVGTFTKEAFDAAGVACLNIKLEKDAYVGDGVDLPAVNLYNAAIVNINEGNYDRQFAARTYVVINYGDTTETIYGDFSETDHVRSVKEVAQACIEDGDIVTDAELKILNKFAGLQ